MNDMDAALRVGREEQADESRRGSQFFERFVQA